MIRATYKLLGMLVLLAALASGRPDRTAGVLLRKQAHKGLSRILKGG